MEANYDSCETGKVWVIWNRTKVRVERIEVFFLNVSIARWQILIREAIFLCLLCMLLTYRWKE